MRKLSKTAKPKNKLVNFMLLDGGLGDHTASLIVMDYIIKKYSWVTPLLWVPDYLVAFAKHVLPNRTYVKSFTDMRYDYDSNITTRTTKWDGVISAMKIHIADYAFLKLTDENPSIEHKNSLKVRPEEINLDIVLPDKYVVVTAGFTAKAREFPAKHINDIAKYVKEKGYEVIFLGQTKTITGSRHIIEGNFSEDIDFSQGLNLIDKTTLLEAAKVLSHAKAVIGVDNGLLHVAGCTDTAIVGGFTSVRPEIRMPIRNNILGWNYYPVVPDAKSDCCACQQETNFLYGHDYRSCIYADDKCVNEMSADKFIEKLKLIL